MTENEYYANLSKAKELHHHGISGMKWGKKNGPPYPLGASDHSASEKKAGTTGWTKDAKNDAKDHSTAKTVAKVVATTAITATAVTAGAVALSKMKKLSTTEKAIRNARKYMHKTHVEKKMRDTAIDALYGAKYSIKKGVHDGIHEGLQEGPKKAAKAVGIGLSMLGMKELMDMSIGKETSAKVFKANNNKKIDSFWRVGQEDKYDRD